MKIGIIGGSGLYDIDGFKDSKKYELDTPFGSPSCEFTGGTFEGREVFFLPRHGIGHRLMPSEINHRANIFGFKLLGAECILSVSAVGSLKEELRPRDIVLPDQYFDRTKSSEGHTFFGDGLVAHISFGDPTCGALRKLAAETAREVITDAKDRPDVKVVEGGTYVNMEGPAFSTRAESNTYRSLGFDVVGMTGLPEAKLCREGEICYQALAMVTDYDCWKESEEEVNVELVIGHLMANSQLAKAILRKLIPRIPAERGCSCGRALENAILTQREHISGRTVEKLEPLVGKYLRAER